MDFREHPVLVVAGDTTIGLSVIRSLGRRGVPVYCASSLKDALGPHSSYCRGSFRMPKDPEGALGIVREHLAKWKITHIAAIAEHHISFLNRHREELEKQCTLLFPRQEVFERAIRKDLTIECAKRAGVPTPETLYPQTMAEVAECRRLRFPVILKMAFHQFPPGTVVVFQHKYLRIESFEELQRVLGALPENQYPMVQEYIPGHGVGVSMLIRGGETVLAFQHRRIREFPPEGGFGVVCEAVEPAPMLTAEASRLLAEMGWDGVAMVEFRVDPESGRHALMEVNGRFWGSLPTAIHAGADFPYWLYRTAFPGAERPSRSYRVGMRARALTADTKWLINVLKNRKMSAAGALRQYLAGFHPSMRYFIWAWDDPAPALRNFAGRFWKPR